jgi:protein TonB
MRDRAARALGYAVLASLLLHALVLVALPAAREFAALVPPEAEPLIARVEHLAPPPEPAPAPLPVVRKPAPPAPVAVAKTAPEPAPAPSVREPAAQTAPVQPRPAPAADIAPAALPAPAPAPPPAIDPRIRRDYARRINAAAEDYKIYPRVAIDNHWRGEVALVMAIAADGRVSSLRIAQSSGHKVLDDQALEMFARAKPRVPVPAPLRGRAFELELLAVFRFEGRP